MIPKYKYWFFKKSISNKVCKDIVDYGLQQKDSLGIIKGADTTKEDLLKKTRDSHVSFISQQWLYNVIHPFVHKANHNAGWKYEWDYTEPVQFTKYKLNQFYDWHQDSFEEVYEGIDNKEFNGKTRKLSTIVTLTDHTEYEGGELEFIVPSGKNDAKPFICNEIKEKGSVVVFPSFMWHRVKPVTKGTRISLVSWSLGKPFK